MPRAQEPGRSVSSRLWDLLFAFDPDHTELSLADLVRRTGMPHATARRLTLELVEAGAPERTRDNRFAIGLQLWRLGTLAPRAETLRSAAQPFVADLYTALRQHVQLAVLQGDRAVIIERLSASTRCWREGCSASLPGRSWTRPDSVANWRPAARPERWSSRRN